MKPAPPVTRIFSNFISRLFDCFGGGLQLFAFSFTSEGEIMLFRIPSAALEYSPTRMITTPVPRIGCFANSLQFRKKQPRNRVNFEKFLLRSLCFLKYSRTVLLYT